MIKKYRLKNWVKIALTLLAIIFIITLLVITLSYLNKCEEEHIENVSNKCALQGYGITAKYTKEGDKYYACNKEDLK